jgi:hypothetical protein
MSFAENCTKSTPISEFCGQSADTGLCIMEIKRGDKNAAGMVFWALSQGHLEWVTHDEFEARSKKLRAKWVDKTKANAYAKKYRQNNLDKVKESQKAWRENNRARNSELVKSWYQRNPERIKEIRDQAQARYHTNHPEKHREKDHRRRARVKSSVALDHNPKFTDALEKARKRVSDCTGVAWNLDHIVPLAAGGPHAHYNLRLLPATWNMRRGSRKSFKLPSCYDIPNPEQKKT